MLCCAAYDGAVVGEETCQPFVGSASGELQHGGALAHEEREVVAVVEGDGVVLYGDAAVEPSGAVGGEAQRHFGGAAGGHVDGGQRALMAADEELQRHLLGVVVAAVVHSDLHGYAAALEVSRSVEDEGVDEQVVGFGALQGYEGYVGETVGR